MALAESSLAGEFTDAQGVRVMQELLNPDNIEKYPEFVEVVNRIEQEVPYRV